MHKHSKTAVFLRGSAMGMADLVPGISGGTIAYITGIYPQLMAAIGVFNGRWFKHIFSFNKKEATHALNQVHWGFILPLFGGMGGAIVVFVWLVPLGPMVKAHPIPFYSLFFGFVLTSALFLLGRYASFCPRRLVYVFIGAFVAYQGISAVPLVTPQAPWFLFVSGVFAISAMLLPGLSGALVLVVLGQYHYVLNALKGFDALTLMPFIGGLLGGLLLFGHGLNWLIKHHYKNTMLTMTGLLFGSLKALWPLQTPSPTNHELFTAGSFFTLGCLLIIALYTAKSFKKP